MVLVSFIGTVDGTKNNPKTPMFYGNFFKKLYHVKSVVMIKYKLHAKIFNIDNVEYFQMSIHA